MGRDTDFQFGANARGCMKWNVCPECGTQHGYCSEITKVPQQSNSSDTKDDMPKKNFKKLPFLKADDLPEKGNVEMKITGNTRAFEGDYGLKINMDVEIKGKKYTFGVKPTNPGLRVIIDSLAQRKTIKVERADYNGNEYVQVCGVPERG